MTAGDKAIASLLGIEITGNNVKHIARFRNGAGPIDANFIDFYSSIEDGIIMHEWAMGGETKTFVRFVPNNIDGYACEFRITPDAEQHDRDALRGWILGCIGRRPIMRTAIGREAVELIMKTLTADLQALESIK